MLVLRENLESNTKSPELDPEFDTFYKTNKTNLDKIYQELQQETQTSIIDITNYCQSRQSSQEKEIKVKGIAEEKEEGKEDADAAINKILEGNGYRLQDVPNDGNCAIWAVLVSAGKAKNPVTINKIKIDNPLNKEEQIVLKNVKVSISQEEINNLMNVYNNLKAEGKQNWKNCKQTLWGKTQNPVKKMLALRKDCKLGNPGAPVALKKFKSIAKVIKQPILVMEVGKKETTYTLYRPEDKKAINKTAINKTKRNNKKTEAKNIEAAITKIKELDGIFIYKRGNHYQAIVKGEE